MRSQNETIDLANKILNEILKHMKEEPDCKCIKSILNNVFE
jgi:hypothetical protein